MFAIDTYAVLGNPVAHSKSPPIYLSFAQAAGYEINYLKLFVPTGEFASTVDKFRALGAKGINITLPCKGDAYHYATVRSEAAEISQASNCLKFTADGVVHAENFDGVGLIRDIVHNHHTPLTGKRVLILGAGGATRGLLMPLQAEQPASITVCNRDQSRLMALHELLKNKVAFDSCDYPHLKGEYDVVMNATSASLSQVALPLPDKLFAKDALAYELVYGKGLTPFLKQAQAQGVKRVADGVGMLAEQAAEAFHFWYGQRPPTQEVIRMLTVPLR
jgi:shikimate dehydrogenase